MQKNRNIVPRELSDREKADMEKDIYDSFANYLSFCPVCGYVDKTNMYLVRAKTRLKKLAAQGEPCPNCGRCQWILGYPDNTPTGFVKF